MFQSFDATAAPEHGPERLALLRAQLTRWGLDGFLVPRADTHQGEYVAPRDERLAWLTGFTGSAGFCIVTPDQAGVFIDGRYRVQVKDQVALSVFTPVPWPETRPADWLRQALPAGGVIGFDPWLHTPAEIADLTAGLAGSAIRLRASDNALDAIWHDQPGPAKGPIRLHPVALAGASAAEKRARIAAILRAEGQGATVLSLPDSISWLLNIRGADVACNPVVQAFATLDAEGAMTLFVDPAKYAHDPDLAAYLAAEARLAPPEALLPALADLPVPVRLDRASLPLAVADSLAAAGRAIAWAEDPCLLPKACKTTAELAATTEAHLRDGAAMAEFLAWLDREAPKGQLTEIAVVEALEGFRRATNALRDISFDTICGAGPHGAIVHYRVTRASNRALAPGELLLVDSGAQYQDGTTDITRTIAIGPPGQDEARAFTRVLRGMMAISRLAWPPGRAGRDLDVLARYPLWLAGQDYDHGTGHGVGAYLSVHEGPARLSRLSDVALQPGMILSNEPGYYREGAFGIRIENLLVVEARLPPPGGDAHRSWLGFRTLTFVPIDRRLIRPQDLSAEERAWIDAYHAAVAEKIAPRLSPGARDWLAQATAPLATTPLEQP